MEIGARIASAQLQGLIRSRRQIVVGPLVGLLHDEDLWFLSTVVAAEPGVPFDLEEVPWAIETIRKAFAAEGRWVSAELIEEANPGLAEALAANGMTLVSRPPLLVVEPADLVLPEFPEGVTASVVSAPEEQAEVDAVAAAAYEMQLGERIFQADPVNGASILVRADGVPVATAVWTAVADGVTEVAGVGTLPSHRRRGLGALATAYATQQAFELGGATLAWLTPGDDGADRIYRRLGYTPQATAVHLGDPGRPPERPPLTPHAQATSPARRLWWPGRPPLTPHVQATVRLGDHGGRPSANPERSADSPPRRARWPERPRLLRAPGDICRLGAAFAEFAR